MANKKGIKKNKEKNVEKNILKEDDSFLGDVWGKLFVVLGVISFFCCFYLLTIFLTDKDTDKKDEKAEEVVISEDKTIVGRALNMSDGEYYVIFYDESNEDVKSVYETLVEDYKGRGNKIYTVNMSNSFNKKYATSEESNKNVETSADFKINGPTLIKVVDHKVTSYLEGEASITEELK
ncbi:MAG: hypothetical protein IKF37_01540 [Bacilli bacterium]|nr:hypothetical protein [Bacilli bacterium]